MATATPRYMIRQSTYIEGIGCLAREGPTEVELPANFPPRNSFEPLNDAAFEAFRRRDEALLTQSQAKIKDLEKEIAAQKEEGATDEELAGLTAEMAALRAAHHKLPRQLKQVPVHGKGRPEYSLTKPVLGKPVLGGASPFTPIAEPPLPQGGPVKEEAAQRLIQFARQGGANEKDLAALAVRLGLPAVQYNIVEKSEAPAPAGAPEDAPMDVTLGGRTGSFSPPAAPPAPAASPTEKKPKRASDA